VGFAEEPNTASDEIDTDSCKGKDLVTVPVRLSRTSPHALPAIKKLVEETRRSLFYISNSPIFPFIKMMNDLPTTIFVPTGRFCEEDDIDDSEYSDDLDDLSLTKDIIREHARCAAVSATSADFTRRAPPRTVSAGSRSLARSPVQLMQAQHHPPRQVSPASVPREIVVEVPPTNPLEQKYRDGLKKLAKSMKESDMTRNVIKRQSKFTYRVIKGPGPFKQKDFFLSSRCEELESCRRQLMEMLQNGL